MKNIEYALENLIELEKLASQYKNTQNAQTINRLVGPYLRNASGRYYDSLWKTALRNVSRGFNKYVEKNNPSLVENLNDNFEVEVSYMKIDFIHLIATIEGYNDRTNLGRFAPSSYFGWAGDLASEAPNLEDRLQSRGLDDTLENAKRYSKLSGRASTSDMITDIDAALIADLTLDSSTKLSEAIETYYKKYSSDRFTLFQNSFGNQEKLEKKVKAVMLGEWDVREFTLHLLGDGPVDDIYYEAMAYRFSSFIDKMSK